MIHVGHYCQDPKMSLGVGSPSRPANYPFPLQLPALSNVQSEPEGCRQCPKSARCTLASNAAQEQLHTLLTQTREVRQL